jgi:hypothetical protein
MCCCLSLLAYSAAAHAAYLYWPSALLPVPYWLVWRLPLPIGQLCSCLFLLPNPLLHVSIGQVCLIVLARLWYGDISYIQGQACHFILDCNTVHRQNVLRHTVLGDKTFWHKKKQPETNVMWTKRPEGQKVVGTKHPMDKTYIRTKRP